MRRVQKFMQEEIIKAKDIRLLLSKLDVNKSMMKYILKY